MANESTTDSDTNPEHPEPRVGVQGIRKRREFRDLLNKTIPNPQIILLQEHHMSLEDCLLKTSELEFKGGIHFWNHARFSASGNRFTGGTGILIGPKIAPYVVDSGVIIESRAQFVIIDIADIKIGVLNIYAPNDTASRARFWATLSHFDFPDVEWVLGGGF